MKESNFEPNEELDPDENLRMDNQIKRLQLEMQGAKFVEFNPEGIQLPAEIEAQMLDQILEFEKIKNSAQEIPLYEFLKKPKFKSMDKLSSEEIILEKERLLKLYERRGIILTSIMPVDDREMYRFMTEEFLEIPILNLQSKGFVRHFIYEEFHPNDELNIMQTLQAFFNTYFKHDERFSLEMLCKENALSYLTNFKSLYAYFEKFNFEVIKLDIKKIKATLHARVEFDAFIENSRKSHRFEGEMKLTLWKKKNFWFISEVLLPNAK